MGGGGAGRVEGGANVNFLDRGELFAGSAVQTLDHA